MPTLKSGNGELENGSSEIIKSPGLLSSTMNKAGVVLWIIGATVATDVAAQQAPNNLTPKVPALTGPAVPGNTENASEIPTAQTIIDILWNGKETIKRKFSTYNDAVFQQIVGQIGLGTVKSETLTALAGAFEKGSPEWEALMNFSKVVRIPKPALGSKEDLALKKAKADAEKAKADAEKEAARIAKMAPKLLKDFREWIRSASKWTAINAWADKVDTKVEITQVAGKIIIKFPKNGKTLWLGEFMAEVPAWSYDLTVKMTGGPLIYWHGDKRLELKNGETTPIELAKPNFKLGGYVTKTKPVIEIEEIVLTPKEPKWNVVVGS